MPHCIHSTKRCHACGLHTGKDCAIVEMDKADHRGPQFYPYKGFFVPVERIDSETMSLLSEFTED